MRKFRHKSLDYFLARPLPKWGGDLTQIDFENIFYYIKPTEKQANSWEDLPAEIKDTWDKLGIPEAEKKYLAGVGAQYESEVVYHKLRRHRPGRLTRRRASRAAAPSAQRRLETAAG
jgi:Fe-S cluster assembly protein SufB